MSNLRDDVDRSAIHPDARILGGSYLSGERTSVGAGAVVKDSRLHNAVIAPGAEVVDSIVVSEGKPGSHRCDTAGRVTVSGTETPEIGTGAKVEASTLINSSVATDSRVQDTFARDVRIGANCRITAAKMMLVETGRRAVVTGPTEISEAYLGDCCTIDRRGYFEGVFSNAFRKLEFDSEAGKLHVTDTIELPHVSRYGVNSINSTNSGKLLPQPNGVLKGLGPHVRLWADALLSHEQIELGPCCWVAPWTKIIGQSPQPHASDEELVRDPLMTYVMPFALAGWQGGASNGLVAPGELSVGYGPKKRKGAWVFTYAPDLVIRTVRRLYDALEEQRKPVADTIVVEAVKTAMALARAGAAERNVDLSADPASQRRGWPRWLASTHALLSAHLEAKLWEFDNGEPREWKLEDDRWTHPRIDALLEVAPDALEKQVSEDEIFTFEDPGPAARVALPTGSFAGSGGPAQIDPGAEVADDAFVGPGSVIGAGSRVGPGAQVWNSVLEDAAVERNARVQRCVLEKSTVGEGSSARSCSMRNSALGARSLAECAALADSQLAASATVSAFGDLEEVTSRHGAILGGRLAHSRVNTVMMSMHMAGGGEHVNFVPLNVELDGRMVEVAAVPMIGGGALLRGSTEAPIVLECSFIGSNAIIEAGCFVGYGCFVLGRLPGGEGLPPFTSCSGLTQTHAIGAVLAALPSTIITHFINWTFQALGPAAAPAVAAMTLSAIREGHAAVTLELERREAGRPFDPEAPGGRYTSLQRYSDAQLRSGLDAYAGALSSGAWEIEFDGKQLVFSSEKGQWQERGGSAFWQTA